MKVRAKETGFYDGKRRRPGTVFEIPQGTKLGKWMERVDVSEKPAPQVRAPQASTVQKIDPLVDAKNKDRAASKHDAADLA